MKEVGLSFPGVNLAIRAEQLCELCDIVGNIVNIGPFLCSDYVHSSLEWRGSSFRRYCNLRPRPHLCAAVRYDGGIE